MTFGFQIHTNTCYGCKTCSITCKNEKPLSPDVFLRRVRQVDSARPGIGYVSMGCNHCDEPACMAICPVSAYTKLENGIVVQDRSLCIGCQSCVNACPFHAPMLMDRGSEYANLNLAYSASPSQALPDGRPNPGPPVFSRPHGAGPRTLERCPPRTPSRFRAGS